jgi:hypothetical protein
MAKRGKGTKAYAVREYLKQHPEAKSSEVAEALTKQGVTITAGHVANIKSKSKIRRRRRRRVVKEVVEKRGIGIKEIKAALALLKVCEGAAAPAKEALAAAIEIRGML